MWDTSHFRCIEVLSSRAEIRRHHAIRGGAAIKNRIGILLVLIIALMLAPKCFPRPSKQPVPQERIHIGVLFYNEVGVPAEQVSAVEEVVSEVLQPAGIELTWNDCTVIRSASGSVSSPCDTSGTPHLPTDFVLYFVGPLEEHFAWVNRHALGYSVIPATHALA